MDASEIDIIDPLIYERGGVPHESFARLRAHAPVHWHHDPDESVPRLLGGDVGEVRRLRSNFIMGIKELPVRFTPSPRRG
jgi:hypothetical protein